jgi:autotransporter-associated beta strand protein
MRGGLRKSVAALACGTALTTASLFAATPGHAQSLWTGGTADYNDAANWFPPIGAPVASGQSAVFDATGSSTSVNVTAGTIAPDSWTFSADSKAYIISGGAVNFSLAGPLGGIISNANLGQTISISNNIGESVAGVQVQQLGNGTLQLLGVNTYGGGTFVGGGGTLLVTNSSSVGTGAVTLDNGQFQGAGAAILTFSNNFKINNTTFGSAIDANGQLLTISGNITDGNGPGALTIVNSRPSHGGEVFLTGTDTYTGGTTICSCGTLGLGSFAQTGSIIGAVTNEGRFSIINANTAGITSITNDGSFGGFATTSFLNATNAGTAAIVNQFGGTTVFNDSSSAMNANITNLSTGGSTLFFNNSSAGNAVITNHSSSGSVLPVGLGFFDNSSAGNATIINSKGGFVAFGKPFFLGGIDIATAGNANITNKFGGELEFAAFTTAGNATITTSKGGAVAFTDNSTADHATLVTNSGGSVTFFDSSSGGTAQFITNGTGIVDFGGGPGFGTITAGSIAGSGTYYIGGGNLLTVGSNNLSTEVSGAIADFNPCGCGLAGSGSLEKVGTGTLTLSGTNTYTGDTLVNGGTLLVTGSIASSSDVSVGSGATLGGTGTVATTTLSNGATLAPGLPTALGTLTVNDLLTFTSGTFYDVKVTSGGNDLTQVALTGHPGPPGVAALAGTVQVTSLNSSYKFNSPYTILTAQGGFGSTLFDALIVPYGINGSLSYPGNNNVNLTLSSALGQLTGLNTNQHTMANLLDTVFNATGSSGNLGAIFSGNVAQNLSQASGETGTGTQQATFDAMNLFLGLLTDPFIDGRGGSSPSPGGAQPFAEEDHASAYAANKQNAARDAFAKFPTKADAVRNNLLDPKWSVWGGAYGGGSTTGGNAALGSSTTTARAFGFAAGADYRISPDLLAGFALAGGGTNFGVNGFGSGRSDLFQAGAFVRRNVGTAYVSGALAYGWQHVTTDRTVTIAGIDQLHAEFNANAWSGRIEGGTRFATPWMGVTPYAAGQFTTFSLPAYAEQVLAGTNAFALNYAAKDVTASRSEIGVRTDRSLALQNAVLVLRGRAAWAHDFNTDRNISAVFQTLPGASFVVNGAAQAHDSALTTASAELKWMNGFSLAASFEGEFSSVTQSYAGKGIVRYVW